jgi:hypothetical protein
MGEWSFTFTITKRMNKEKNCRENEKKRNKRKHFKKKKTNIRI